MNPPVDSGTSRQRQSDGRGDQRAPAHRTMNHNYKECNDGKNKENAIEDGNLNGILGSRVTLGVIRRT